MDERATEPGGAPAGAGERLRIDLLGSVRARRGGTPIVLGPVRRQAVLAALVLRAPAFVTYERLLDDVWGAEPPGTGHEALSALTRHTSTWLELQVRVRLGGTYAAAGRHAEARREFETALALPGAENHPHEYGLARDGLSGAAAAPAGEGS
ncbi:hypothetical protein [Streptomyces sp. NPDC088915]|uniref:AfsR/SARP family transcriptional regulator n=1 Tax=Streptomyces sp. NPDC088915 TaxID=3365912 RepID=UPI0037F5FEA9